MATQAYRDWLARGKPYRLARPVAELKNLVFRHGVRFLGDLGNFAHLTADPPEDHTPFSATEWPSPIGADVVCAIDFADGPWCDRMLADVRAGRLPWLKYMNFRGSNFHRKRGWERRDSSDRHCHMSIMSTHIDASIGSYNPFGVGGGDVDDSTASELTAAANGTAHWGYVTADVPNNELPQWARSHLGQYNNAAVEARLTKMLMDMDRRLTDAIAALADRLPRAN